MVRLMIKTHNKTGLKYLCITTQDDYEKYKGSGVYWQRHLKVHGKDISTTVLFESEHNDVVFKDKCMYYSGLYNVVDDKSWANLRPENGNIAGQYFTPTQEWKDKLSVAHKKRFAENPELKDKISATHKKRFAENPELRELQRHRFTDWIKENPENYEKWLKAQRDGIANRSKESFIEAGKKISKTKLNWSKEKKTEVYNKVSASLKTSEKRKEFNKKMKTARLGASNPAAVKVFWYDKVFLTDMEFKNYIMGLSDISYYKARKMLESDNYPECYKDKPPIIYKKITCPHCNKTNNDTSSFKRWHFDNCKHKE